MVVIQMGAVLHAHRIQPAANILISKVCFASLNAVTVENFKRSPLNIKLHYTVHDVFVITINCVVATLCIFSVILKYNGYIFIL